MLITRNVTGHSHTRFYLMTSQLATVPPEGKLGCYWDTRHAACPVTFLYSTGTSNGLSPSSDCHVTVFIYSVHSVFSRCPFTAIIHSGHSQLSMWSFTVAIHSFQCGHSQLSVWSFTVVIHSFQCGHSQWSFTAFSVVIHEHAVST